MTKEQETNEFGIDQELYETIVQAGCDFHVCSYSFDDFVRWVLEQRAEAVKEAQADE